MDLVLRKLLTELRCPAQETVSVALVGWLLSYRIYKSFWCGHKTDMDPFVKRRV